MNVFLATFLGCLLAIVVALQTMRLWTGVMMRRWARRSPIVGGPLPVMQPLEYPKIDPDDLKTIMIGEMLDNHQITLRKACGCKLCQPFVRLVMPSIVSEQPPATGVAGTDASRRGGI